MALIALVATKGASPCQRKLCDRARRYLDEQKVPYEVVDAKVGDASPDELHSEALTYPQFFLQYGNGEITHLGGLDEIKHLVPVLSAGKDPDQTHKLPQKPLEPKQNPMKKHVESHSDAEKVAKKSTLKDQDPSNDEILSSQSKDVVTKRSKPRKLFRTQETKQKVAVSQSKQTESCPNKDDKPNNKSESGERVNSGDSQRATRTYASNKKSPSCLVVEEEMRVKSSAPRNVTGNVSPSVLRSTSHDIEPPLNVVRVVNCETYQRPDRTRGNSYDDDHSSISDSHSWVDRRIQRIPSLRPSFTRGYSFDDEQPGSSQVSSRPSVAKERAGKVKAKRPAYIRSVSFDESSFDESNHSRREMVPFQSAARSRSLCVPSTSNKEPNYAGSANDLTKIDVAIIKPFDDRTKFTISPGPSWLYSKDELVQKTIPVPLILKSEQPPAPKVEPVDSEKYQKKIDAPDKKSINFDGKTTFSIVAGPDWLYG